MNVSKRADQEFMRLLEIEDPERFKNLMDNIDADIEKKWSPEAERQLTRFMLGLPTKPGYEFEIVAGPSVPVPSVDYVEEDVIKTRKTTRHYKNCLQCATRFLAKRKNQNFCKPICQKRHIRTVPVSVESVLPVSNPV